MAKTSSEKLTSNFLADTDGRIKAVLSDSSGTASQSSAAALADGAANPTTTSQGALLEGFNGTTWDRVRTMLAAGGPLGGTGVLAVVPHVMVASGDYRPIWSGFQAGDANIDANMLTASTRAYNGSTYDRVRTPTVFRSVANASITAATPATYWTPAGGKKFRLMTLSLSMSVAGQILVCDNTNGSIILRSPQLAAAGVWTIGAGDMGNGILSAAANNVLKIDVTSTASVGGFVGGTEE